MGHNHDHAPTTYNRAFAIGTTLNLGFVIIEFIYGQFAHSLALVADAGHNLGDVLGLLLAWGAALLSRRLPTPNRTYGMRRASILAAAINSILLLIACGAIAWEAVMRFSDPIKIESKTVIVVAMIGVLINAATALMFFSGRGKDVNIRSAFSHMAADAGLSLAVAVAGSVIIVTGWLWLDPLMSIVVVFVIIAGTWDLLRDSLNLALDAVPEGIDLGKIEKYLTSLPTALSIHDLHIWGMSTTETALTAHLILKGASGNDAFLAQVERELHDQFGITHVTLQIETGDPTYPCRCRLISPR